MAYVSLWVSDQEKSWMENYAKLHGVSLSDAIKTAFFEKLEDDNDLNVISEYERQKPVKFYSMSEVISELGFKDELPN